jgi:hypothetical protein
VAPSKRTGGFSVSRLNYLGTEFFFEFDLNQGLHYCTYSPGSEKALDQAYPGPWDQQLNYVRMWLQFLERELHAPDLWAEVAKYQITATAGDNRDNEPFTAQQVEQIVMGLNRVRAYIQTNVSPTPDQLRLVNEKLDYLVDAAKRQGRRDWLHTSIGVFVTLATSLGLSPDALNTIWGFLRESISGVMQLIGP